MRERACIECGAVFHLRRPVSPQKFCSYSCRGKAVARKQWTDSPRRLAKRDCEQCGGSFQPRRGHQRFCSRRCVAIATANPPVVRLVGSQNPRYNGGLCIYKGRAMVCCRDGSTLWYSRAVMAAHLERLLRSDKIVHHINGDGSDDRLENLSIVTRAEHLTLHRADLLAARAAA